MNIKDKTRLIHILEAISEIESYREENVKDRKTELAITRLIEIIGEASNRLSDELKSSYSDIPWRQMINMRNIIIHEYFGVDSNALWNVAQYDVPDLQAKISSILKDHSS